MAAVTVATVAKKVAAALASNKKGRKFIGYVIGIAVFILCIPILVVYCVFGWMAGSGEMDLNSAAVNAVKDVPGVQAIQDASDKIEEAFSALGLPAEDVKKAQVIRPLKFTSRTRFTTRQWQSILRERLRRDSRGSHSGAAHSTKQPETEFFSVDKGLKWAANLEKREK